MSCLMALIAVSLVLAITLFVWCCCVMFRVDLFFFLCGGWHWISWADGMAIDGTLYVSGL